MASAPADSPPYDPAYDPSAVAGLEAGLLYLFRDDAQMAPRCCAQVCGIRSTRRRSTGESPQPASALQSKLATDGLAGAASGNAGEHGAGTTAAASSSAAVAAATSGTDNADEQDSRKASLLRIVTGSHIKYTFPDRSSEADWADHLFAVGIELIALFAVVVRISVGLYSYSGRATPPMFGDYEAQRHWMEVTVNLPARDWYEQTKDNDLQYWGLDYPPLSAYWALFLGQIAKLVDPAMVALHSSRGYETPK